MDYKTEKRLGNAYHSLCVYSEEFLMFAENKQLSFQQKQLMEAATRLLNNIKNKLIEIVVKNNDLEPLGHLSYDDGDKNNVYLFGDYFFEDYENVLSRPISDTRLGSGDGIFSSFFEENSIKFSCSEAIDIATKYLEENMINLSNDVNLIVAINSALEHSPLNKYLDIPIETEKDEHIPSLSMGDRIRYLINKDYVPEGIYVSVDNPKTKSITVSSNNPLISHKENESDKSYEIRFTSDNQIKISCTYKKSEKGRFNDVYSGDVNKEMDFVMLANDNPKLAKMVYSVAHGISQYQKEFKDHTIKKNRIDIER